MKIKKGFTLRSVMGQNIVLAEGNGNADSFGKMITLNESAAMLWGKLQGREFEVADAAGLLADTYGIDAEQAQADAAYILGKMAEKGLLDQE